MYDYSPSEQLFSPFNTNNRKATNFEYDCLKEWLRTYLCMHIYRKLPARTWMRVIDYIPLAARTWMRAFEYLLLAARIWMRATGCTYTVARATGCAQLLRVIS